MDYIYYWLLIPIFLRIHIDIKMENKKEDEPVIVTIKSKEMEKAICEYFATDFNYKDSVKIAFSFTVINFPFTTSLWGLSKCFAESLT